MELFRETTIDFMKLRNVAAVFSLLLFVLSAGALMRHGLTLGLDFTGGTQIQLAYDKPADMPQIRANLAKAGFGDAVVQSYGNAEEVLVRVGERKDVSQDQLKEQIHQALPGATLRQAEYIGPQVGHELAVNGIMALVMSFILTGIYIALRFEWRFAVSSTIALIHDPILILGVFSFWHIEFNLITLAAVLTVIGYSLNDTIVIFDRVRENFRKLRKGSPADVVNLSVNQTLSRTIMTSGLTLLVVIALFLYGGPVVHGFSLALIIGIVIGTYSSIYVAGSFAVAMGLNRKDFLPSVREVDDRP